jgi:hypothetical protein
VIDESTAELLSRFLDGDLEAGEARRLETRLESDPELAAELAALDRIRHGVRSVAAGMKPPEELDLLLEPLRTGEPHGPRRIHPAIRWIGMAAGLALAVTVALEVARTTPDPRDVVRAPTAPPDSEVFQLSPLPTSTVPEGEEKLGASDRLLDSPPTEPELDEPEALEVRGPLTLDEKSADASGRDIASPAAPESAQIAPSEEKARRRAPTKKEAPAAASLDAATLPSRPGKGALTVRVVLVGDDGATIAEIDLPGPAPSTPTEVTFIDGVIVEVVPAGSDTDSSAPTSHWLGQQAPNVPDGRYRALATGEPRAD